MRINPHPSNRHFIFGGLLAAIIVLMPWNLYQNIIDPPGNRLLKWHLAGIQNIDSRPLWQTLCDSYEYISFKQFLALKLTNLQAFFGTIVDWKPLVFESSFVLNGSILIDNWIPLVFKASFALLGDHDGGVLREKHFSHLFAILGLWGLILPVTLFTTMKQKDYRCLWLLLIATLIAFVEVLLMFGPNGPVIHQGSFLLVCLSFAGAILSVIDYNRLLAWSLAAMQLFLTVFTYIRYTPTGQVFKYDQTLWLLAAVAFVCVIILLWKIADDKGVVFS